MSFRMIAAVTAALAMAGSASAQQIEWKQVTNMPKGQNLPQGVKADLQGIELGMSYDEAKAVLQELVRDEPHTSQSMPKEKNVWGRFAQQPTDDRLIESIETISLPVPGGLALAAQYVGEVTLQSTTRLAIDEGMTVKFGAPSSGNQVYSVDRFLTYREPKDQPLVSELLVALKKKFGDAVYDDGGRGGGRVFTWLFSKGTGLAQPTIGTCDSLGGDSQLESNALNRINANRKCDVTLTVSTTYGISKDHASVVRFELRDVQRNKENSLTDLYFFDSYVKNVQQTTHGAPPKL